MPKRVEQFKGERLEKVAMITEELERLLHWRALMVKRSLESGATWAEIGKAEKMTGESARKHFGIQRKHYLDRAS